MKDKAEAKRPPLGDGVRPDGVVAGGKIQKILNYKNESANTEALRRQTGTLCFLRALIFDRREDLSRQLPD